MTDIPPVIIVLVGGVCIVLGFLASVLLNTLKEESESTTEEEVAVPPGGRKGRYTPVARLWRERGTDALLVELDGKTMVSSDMLTTAQRERLERSHLDLRAWLGLVEKEPPLATAAAPDLPAWERLDDDDLNRLIGAGPTNPEPAPEPNNPATAAPRPASSPETTPYSAAPTPDPVSPAVVKIIKEPEKPRAVKSIVLQIEDILQAMIAGTPLAQRGLHLMEDSSRGVLVQIGLDRYVGIDAVPDPEIRDLIRSAVQKWEKSQ